MGVGARFLLYQCLQDRYHRSSITVNRLSLYLDNDDAYASDPAIQQRASRVVFDALFELFPVDRYGLIVDLFCMKLSDAMLGDIVACLPGSEYLSSGSQLHFVATGSEGLRNVFEKFFPLYDEFYARVYRKPSEWSAENVETLLGHPVKRDERAYVEGTTQYHASASLSLKPLFLGVFSLTAPYEQAEQRIREVATREGFELIRSGPDDAGRLPEG